MTQSSISVYKCDRCDRVDEIRKAYDSYEWGKATYFQYNGPKYNSHPTAKTTVPPDICPTCLNELHEWWMKGKDK